MTPESGEEHLDRIIAKMRNCKVNEAAIERVRRLNPGITLGYIPRGYRMKLTIRHSSHVSVVTRRQFDERWGKGTHRLLSKRGMAHAGGKRYWISGEQYEDGPPQLWATHHDGPAQSVSVSDVLDQHLGKPRRYVRIPAGTDTSLADLIEEAARQVNERGVVPVIVCVRETS